MDNNYQTYFGFKKQPFSSDLNMEEILLTDELQSVKKRFDYAVELGGIALITGDIGSGKSTALRYASEALHSSEYKVFYVTATSGPILELYRQIMDEMGILGIGRSKAAMTSNIRREIREIVDAKRMKAVLVIDEASLLRLDVIAELHTLTQFHKDSKPWLPVILAGQSMLVDKLMYRTSAPLASRVITRSHLEGLNLDGMKQYIDHHLELAGANTSLFDDPAITAVHQGSGGLLRKSNHLARGALMAAALSQAQTINADHVRLAATEIF